MRLWGSISAVLSASAAVAAATDAVPSKKEVFRAEKVIAARPGPRGKQPVVTIVNAKTRETLPVVGAGFPTADEADRLLRCHFTGERAYVDPRLLALAVEAARAFGRDRVEVVSGYRAPKYNRLLRKKGREVARHSQHVLGHALDFRVPGVGVRALRRFVEARGGFGVGIYPRSDFLHVDTGPTRRWGGT